MVSTCSGAGHYIQDPHLGADGTVTHVDGTVDSVSVRMDVMGHSGGAYVGAGEHNKFSLGVLMGEYNNSSTANIMAAGTLSLYDGNSVHFGNDGTVTENGQTLGTGSYNFNTGDDKVSLNVTKDSNGLENATLTTSDVSLTFSEHSTGSQNYFDINYILTNASQDSLSGIAFDPYTTTDPTRTGDQIANANALSSTGHVSDTVFDNNDLAAATINILTEIRQNGSKQHDGATPQTAKPTVTVGQA